MNNTDAPRSDFNSFEKATIAEIGIVSGIEAGFATYPSDKQVSQYDSIHDALVHGFIHGAYTLIDALQHLNDEYPTPDSLGAGFLAELLDEGINRGLGHHGITITHHGPKEEGGE